MFALMVQWTDGKGKKAHKVISPIALMSEVREQVDEYCSLYGALPDFCAKVVMRDEYIIAVNSTLEVMMADDGVGTRVLRRTKDEEEDS